jgi:hypothetical protein
MSILFALVFFFGQAEEKDFAELLKRFEADDPGVRERASRDLDQVVRKLGPRAATFLKEKMAGAEGEVLSRLREKLAELRRIEKCWDSIACLDALGLPDLKGKPLVLFNLGFVDPTQGEMRFESVNYALGWLLTQSKEEVRILDLDAGIQVFSRSFQPPEGWEKIKLDWPKDLPLPGETLAIPAEVAYERVCSAYKLSGPDLPLERLLYPAMGKSFHSALFIRWALLRGEERGAQELLEASQAALRRDEPQETRPYSQVLTELVCHHLRYLAITSKEPRGALLNRWQTLRRLQPNYRSGEVGEMILLHEKLIAEEAAWKEPGKPSGAEYWIYRLRDVAGRGSSREDCCRILPPTSDRSEENPDPPEELLKLGWDALPILIEHLDDPRPTRSVTWHEDNSRNHYYLLRVGDCCRQIFEAITGVSISREGMASGSMVKDGDAPASQVKARKWWTQNRDTGAEKFFIAALERAETAADAATRLLAMDQAKHLPRLLEILARGARGPRNAILVPLGPHLGKEHERLIEAVLLDGDPDALVAATKILWDRFHSDRGAIELISRLRRVDPSDEDSVEAQHDVWCLWPVRTERVARALPELMRSKHVQLRMHAHEIASGFPHPLLAAELVAQFSDKTSTGWTGLYEIRFCDRAAEALLSMLGLEEKFPLKGSPEERDRTIGALKEWWDKEKDALHWMDLLEKAERADRLKSGGK